MQYESEGSLSRNVGFSRNEIHPAIIALGPKALTMFFTGTIGVVVGGPFAVAIMGGIWPSTVRGDEVWRGLAFVAGEWIGGGSNGNASECTALRISSI